MKRSLVLALLLACGSVAHAQEEKAYRGVTSERVEGVLKAMDVTYQKNRGKKDNEFNYDFERANFKLRLHNYQGTDLWLDAHFAEKISPEVLNQWNQRARITRAVLVSKEGKDTISLEAQLDCLSGTSDAIVRQFVVRFEGELKDFVKFLTEKDSK